MMAEVTLPVARELLLPEQQPGPLTTSRTRRVFDAGGGDLLPGRLVLDERHPDGSADLRALEAFRALGAIYNFLAVIFLRNSIDNRGMVLDATVHFRSGYANAFWNGRQMVFGDGDGKLFGPLTRAIEVVAHEVMHGVVQHSARLPYTGQSGALCEHLADTFGIMTRQFFFCENARKSNWLIGAGVFGPSIKGKAIRSMLHPGTAYDDPILGRDPQPQHMRDYVHTPDDNGGVHVNSGIPNRAFALAALELGGFAWSILGRIWYRVMTSKLLPDATFSSFANDTVAAAGELYGHGGSVQDTVLKAWQTVGVRVRRPLRSAPRPAVQ
jgi:Zn-dependent metalloprotease